MRGVVSGIFAGILVTACAKPPESISAFYISEVGYVSWTCEQLAEEQHRLSSAYAVAAAQQKKARTNDIVGVIFIGLPVSSLSGDNIAPEIARLKGEQEAVRKAMIRKDCSHIPPPNNHTEQDKKRTPEIVGPTLG